MDFSKRREEIKLQCLHIDHSNSEWDRYKHWLPPEGCKGERTLPAWAHRRFPAFLIDSGPWTGLWKCDVALYNKYVFGPWPLFQHRAPKILGTGLEESDQMSPVMLMRWLIERLTLETVCQENQVSNWRVGFSVPPLNLWGVRGLEVESLSMANDTLDRNYVVKRLKTQKAQGSESFCFGECTEIWGEWSLSKEVPCPFPMPCPLHLFHLALLVCACTQQPPILLRLHRLLCSWDFPARNCFVFAW